MTCRTTWKELPKLAKAPAFQAAAERLGRIFNRKPAPWRRRKGVTYFHDVSLAKHLARHFGEPEAIGGAALDQASRLLMRLQDELLSEGFVLVFDAIRRGACRDPPADGRQVCGVARRRHQRHQLRPRHRGRDRLAQGAGSRESLPGGGLRP
jgi:hypothetical protein